MIRVLHSAVFLMILFSVSQTRGESEAEEKNANLVLPRLLQEPEVAYPIRAFEENISASVIMEIDIDAEGLVESVVILVFAEPTGYGFDEAASDAAAQFVFSPALEDGVPIPVRITYRYEFVASVTDEIGNSATDILEREAESITASAASDDPGGVVNFAGILREKGTRLPVAGVNVTVFRGSGSLAIGYETTTDGRGRFSFVDLASGTWMILAEAAGFYPLRTRDDVTQGERTEVVYYIERGEYSPYDVLIEEETVRKEVSRITLDVAVVEKIPGTFGDILTVVQNLPGVAQTGAAAGNIVIRGSSAEDSLIFVEGVNVPIIYHFGGLRSVIPLGMLDSLDFYPGNFSASFGRATGGIVDVRLKKLRPQQVSGYVDVNLADAGAYLEVPLGPKSAIAAAFRRSYIDAIINAAVPESDTVNLLTAPRYYDYQVLTAFRPSQRHELTGFFFGSDDKLKVVVDNPADVSADLRATQGETSTSFYRTLLQYQYTPSLRFSNVLKVSAGRNRIYAGLGDQAYLDLNTYVAQIQDSATISLSENASVTLGLDYLMSKTDVSIKLPVLPKEGEIATQPNLDTTRFTDARGETYHSTGFFAEWTVRLLDRWTLVPGIRYDWFSRVDQSVLAPRFNTRLSLTNQWDIKGGVGVYHREPSFDETSPVFGNPNLGLEKAMHYSAGFEFIPLPYLTLDVTGFYKPMTDLVSRTTETILRDGALEPLNFVNGGEGRVYGLEILLRHDFANHFTGWLSYTLSRALRKDFEQTEWRRFDFDQTHILTTLGTWQLPANWTVGFRWRLVSGNPYTPRIGAVYSVDKARYEPVFDTPNSARLPLFHQLDVRLDKRWIYRTWMLTAYLDVQNIYNSPNVTGYAYNYDSSQKRPRQGLPLLPILGLKGEF